MKGRNKYFIALLIGLFSCLPDPLPNLGPCDVALSPYFIKPEIDGKEVYMAFVDQGKESVSNTFNESLRPTRVIMERWDTCTLNRGMTMILNGVNPQLLITPDTIDQSDLTILYRVKNDNGYTTYSYDPEHIDNFEVIIKSISGDQVIGGTFNGELVNSTDSTDKVTINNGTFDIKLITIN